MASLFFLSVKPSSRVSFFTRAHANFALHQGPVVRTPVSANPGLILIRGSFSFYQKHSLRIIFSVLFRVSSHQIVGKENLTEFGFEALISEFKFPTNPGLPWPSFEQPGPVSRYYLWGKWGIAVFSLRTSLCYGQFPISRQNLAPESNVIHNGDQVMMVCEWVCGYANIIHLHICFCLSFHPEFWKLKWNTIKIKWPKIRKRKLFVYV